MQNYFNGEPLGLRAKVVSIYNFTTTYGQLLEEISPHCWCSLEWDHLHGHFQVSSLLKEETRTSKQRTGLAWTGKHHQGIWYLLNPLLGTMRAASPSWGPQAIEATSKLRVNIAWRPRWKCKHKMAQNSSKKSKETDLTCWTIHTNSNLSWIWLRAHFGQHDQTIIPIFSVTYCLLNNSSKQWKIVPSSVKMDLIHFPLKSIEIFPCLQRKLD